MASFGLSNQPFFADKNRAFWRLQAVGWGGYLLLRTVSTFANERPWSYAVQFTISTITGLSLTLLMAVIYRSVFHRKTVVMWSAAVATVAIASLLYATIDAWVFSIIQRPGEPFDFTILLGTLLMASVLLAAWTAMYFGINYYLIVEEQIDRLAAVESQATSAHLAMLRYQLNPHFLFNTLNSISTLVLLKQTERANAMLSRLSSFLRYTLVNEPTANVTIAQEVETLKLYLEIEKMRFDARLQPEFYIDPATMQAQLPSLLLQPLVENAIKYAVTPQEEGATITIATRLAGDRVHITVSDTGPGLQEKTIRPTLSTGVGHANIRERLAQAFGPDHRFETRSNPGGGFGVEIEIPLQLDGPRPRETA
ncbi:sensor histidine kinase [Sphingomonas gilva]|uniref:Sensor histidine kinase n=1 Tax=Sphingomonas gilva TaxID=2305907 RepID=A0A396RR77_9SPHN|nr:histidine kinase [Sphingomonas gilva]RHW16793.1 sensor histidine kinase [Sphingomonas gilva]